MWSVTAGSTSVASAFRRSLVNCRPSSTSTKRCWTSTSLISVLSMLSSLAEITPISSLTTTLMAARIPASMVISPSSPEVDCFMACLVGYCFDISIDIGCKELMESPHGASRLSGQSSLATRLGIKRAPSQIKFHILIWFTWILWHR